jgi:MFS superfamily sulfate permease-like transporter
MDPVEVTTINVAAMLVLLGGLIAKVVQRIRHRFPRIDGDLVSLLAILLGAGLAWSLDLRGAADLAGSAGLDLGAVPAWLDYALTGIGLGLGAGVINDLITKTPPSTNIVVNGIGGDHEAPELPEDGLGSH